MKKKLLLLALSTFLYCVKGQTLDATIQDEMDYEKFPSVSACIIKEGKTLWKNSYGYADVDNQVAATSETVYLLASVSKVFTATAAMQLVEAGDVSLDADINDYLSFDIVHPNYPLTPITLRMLLTHTACIQDSDAMDNYYAYNQDPTMSLDEIMHRYFSPSGADYDVVNNFHNNEPGTFYDYSNIATALVGYIVEEVSGMDFKTYCDQNIFEALCMDHTSWRLSDYNNSELAVPYQYSGGSYQAYDQYTFADYPNGGLRTSVDDLSKFIAMYLKLGSLSNEIILNSSTVESMMAVQNANVDPTQGLSWYLEDLLSASLWSHNGGEDGVSTDVFLDFDNEIGIIVLTNGEGDAYYVAEAMYQYALDTPALGEEVVGCGNVGVSEADQGISDLEFSINDNVFWINNSGEFQLEVYGLDGKRVLNQRINSGTELNLNNGAYLIKLTDLEDSRITNSRLYYSK